MDPFVTRSSCVEEVPLIFLPKRKLIGSVYDIIMNCAVHSALTPNTCSDQHQFNETLWNINRLIDTLNADRTAISES